jgi:hypothetical protein
MGALTLATVVLLGCGAAPQNQTPAADHAATAISGEL